MSKHDESIVHLVKTVLFKLSNLVFCLGFGITAAILYYNNPAGYMYIIFAGMCFTSFVNLFS